MIRWILDAQQSQLAFAFGIIFVAVLAVKKNNVSVNQHSIRH
ncbi:hypothetical protein BSPWISOXPB_9412 [uncultured Gammaproteobacteria bacterium]|nr:hypothetical protein BSPWISOXPB_9412 [uncultured Gammaproteobacteria bacterium]